MDEDGQLDFKGKGKAKTVLRAYGFLSSILPYASAEWEKLSIFPAFLVMYHMAYFSPKVFGGGQFYLINISDRAGKPFEGAKTYRLNVPANAPIQQYWSASAYDRETHALIRGVSRPSLASNDQQVQKNADGSEATVRGAVPPLWAEAGVRREDLEAAGSRGSALKRQMSSTSWESPTTRSWSTATDNGAEVLSWSDGGQTPSRGEGHQLGRRLLHLRA